jgi:hypothetical protein
VNIAWFSRIGQQRGGWLGSATATPQGRQHVGPQPPITAPDKAA